LLSFFHLCFPFPIIANFIYDASINYPGTSYLFNVPGSVNVGDVIYFYVTAVNAEGESNPSNVTNVIIYESASAPIKFAVTALLDSSSTFVDCIFVKPAVTTDAPLYYVLTLTEFGLSFPIFSVQIPYDPTKDVYYESFSSILYPELSGLSQDEIYTSTIPQASAIGAALVIHESWNTNPKPTNLIELKRYN
jgi:hypothetical protein